MGLLFEVIAAIPSPNKSFDVIVYKIFQVIVSGNAVFCGSHI